MATDDKKNERSLVTYLEFLKIFLNFVDTTLSMSKFLTVLYFTQIKHLIIFLSRQSRTLIT